MSSLTQRNATETRFSEPSKTPSASAKRYSVAFPQIIDLQRTIGNKATIALNANGDPLILGADRPSVGDPKIYPDERPALSSVHARARPATMRTTVQRSLADLNDANNYLGSFNNAVKQVVPGVLGLIADLGSRFQNGVAADAQVELASQGVAHDMKELESKAGGYLYQQMLRQKMGAAHVGYARGGVSNNSDPDIALVNVPVGQFGPELPEAIEAKRTIQNTYTTPLTEGIGQLAKRANFAYGRLFIQILDPQLVLEISGNTKLVDQRVEGAVGAQRRSWQNRSYRRISVEFQDSSLKTLYCREVDVTEF